MVDVMSIPLTSELVDQLLDCEIITSTTDGTTCQHCKDKHKETQ